MIFSLHVYCNKRILKIGQHLPKLWAIKYRIGFFGICKFRNSKLLSLNMHKKIVMFANATNTMLRAVCTCKWDTILVWNILEDGSVLMAIEESCIQKFKQLQQYWQNWVYAFSETPGIPWHSNIANTVRLNTKIPKTELNKLCGRPPQYAPAPANWPFDLENGVQVTCDVGYLCANFSLPRPLCYRLRPHVRQTETSIVRRQTRIVA